MAWFDILGGVAGGLQQGLGQLQQAQQAKQVEARQLELLKLQQAQNERQKKEFEQRERDLREASFLKEASLQNPFNVDPAFASRFPEEAKRYLMVDPDTRRTVMRMDPQKRAELQEIFARTQGRNTLREQFKTQEFSALSEGERLRLGLQAAAMGMEPKEILANIGPVSPSNLLTFLGTIVSPEKVYGELSENARAKLLREAQKEIANINATGREKIANINATGRGGVPTGIQETILSEGVNRAQAQLEAAEKYLAELVQNRPYVLGRQSDKYVREAEGAVQKAREKLWQAEQQRLEQAANINLELAKIFRETQSPMPQKVFVTKIEQWPSDGSNFMPGR